MKLAELNHTMISGRLTQDPKYATTQSGKGVLGLQVAVNRKYLDAHTSEWKEEAVFVPVVVWGESATRLKDRCKKGTPVFVEGRLTSNEYTDKEGKTHRNLQITASRVQVLDMAVTEVSTKPTERELGEEEVPF